MLRTIAARLLFWFLLISLLPLTIVTCLSYLISENSLKNEVRINLKSIADNKAKQIEEYARARKRNVTVLARTPEIIQAIEKFQTAFKKGLDSP